MNKISIDRLDINLFYISDSVDYTFSELLKGEGWIQTDECEINKFYQAQGGLELKMDRLFLFFKRTCAEDHFEAVIFLLRSILATSNFKWDHQFDDLRSYSEDKDFERVSMPLGNYSSLKLILDEETTQINIQHLHANIKMNEERNNQYFDNIWVNYRIWNKAASLALEEYFTFIVQTFSDEFYKGVSPQYTKFSNLWSAMKAKLGL